MKSKKKLILFSAIPICIVLFIVWIAWSNTAITVSEFTITSDRIPQNFSGYRIAHISDLHNAEFGYENENLLNMLSDIAPDIIVITGDIVDSYKTDIDIAVSFAREASKIAPTYYVTGNHEATMSNFYTLRSDLESVGVTVMQNRRINLEVDGEKISLIGIDDLAMNPNAVVEYTLERFLGDDEEHEYTILLSHRPEVFETYALFGVDLVFSGHAHGGQFRLPFIGGLFAPEQGFFPKYDAGLYTNGGTNMLVSRGLGNSLIPFRVNNRPEIIVAELRSAE